MKEKEKNLKKVSELKKYFLEDTIIVGNQNLTISNMIAWHLAEEGHLSYFKSSSEKRLLQYLKASSPTAIITDDEEALHDFQTNPIASFVIIYNKNARLQMARLTEAFAKKHQSFTHDATWRLQGNLMSTSTISDLAYIENDVVIGEGTQIYANVTIYSGVKIGKNCTIHSGTVIGSDGFGYEKCEATGEMIKIFHLGGVDIGDNVEIGANTTIDRGCLGNTIIEDGVKIDNLVHIAHNVHVKQNAVIIAQSMIAGSCVIGENAWIAPCSAIREGRSIGNGSLVGLGSVVTKDVPAK